MRGLQVAHRLLQPGLELDIAVGGVILQQPIGHLLERLLHPHALRGVVGHQCQQHIYTLRPLQLLLELFGQLIAPLPFVGRQGLRRQRPRQQAALQLAQLTGIKRLQQIHRCRQPEAGEAMAGMAGLLEAVGRGVALGVTENRSQPCNRPRPLPQADVETEARRRLHLGQRQLHQIHQLAGCTPSAGP